MIDQIMVITSMELIAACGIIAAACAVLVAINYFREKKVCKMLSLFFTFSAGHVEEQFNTVRDFLYESFVLIA